ncbi:thioredoxin-like 2-1, chloroplastic isoform X5 [Elaeis guineensis]|uniref:thioredoxin-like 2-1, chloroplastic isoform X5 n=1 Tax=Elaeis guineensis var. tenera TaxID=51953 RepID=UPI003C6D9E2F
MPSGLLQLPDIHKKALFGFRLRYCYRPPAAAPVPSQGACCWCGQMMAQSGGGEKKCRTEYDCINSKQEFLDALSLAGDRLVIVAFYGTWCGSSLALYPKGNDFVVNIEETCVSIVWFKWFYRGAEGQLESFSCSLAKAWILSRLSRKFLQSLNNSLLPLQGAWKIP